MLTGYVSHLRDTAITTKHALYQTSPKNHRSPWLQIENWGKTIEITPEQIWEAALGEPEGDLAKQTPELQEMHRPLIEALPEILAENLDQPITLMNLAKAKLLVLQHHIQNGVAAVATATIEPEIIQLFGGSEAVQKQMVEAFATLEQQLTRFILDRVIPFEYNSTLMSYPELDILLGFLNNKLIELPERCIVIFLDENKTMGDLLLATPSTFHVTEPPLPNFD